jgi:hypothetical protein
MPLGFGRAILTKGAAASPPAAGTDFTLYETTLATSYKPRGYTSVKFAGLDSNGAPVFVFTIIDTNTPRKQHIKAGRLNTANGTWTFGSTYQINTDDTEKDLDVASQCYGAEYKNSGSLPNDVVQTSGTSTDAAGCFEIMVKAPLSGLAYMYGIWINNDTLTPTLRAGPNTTVSATGETNTRLIELFGDNWVLAGYSAGYGATYWKKEWNTGATIADRGGAINVALEGTPQTTRTANRNAMALITTSGQGNIFTTKNSPDGQEFFVAQCGVDTTGAWSGGYGSPMYNFTYDLNHPSIARLNTKKVLHGGHGNTTSNFYYICSDSGHPNTNSTSSPTTFTLTNSTEYSTTNSDGCMLIDRGDTTDKAFLARLTNASNKLEMIPLDVSGTTVTAGTANEVTTTTSYSNFGRHGGIAQYHPWYVVSTWDGTDAKLLTLKYTGS